LDKCNLDKQTRTIPLFNTTQAGFGSYNILRQSSRIRESEIATMRRETVCPLLFSFGGTKD
jgi:hypothetical protein